MESLKEELNKKESQLMKQVKKFELKLLQENNLKIETLSVKASFKIFENSQMIKSNRKIQTKEIGKFHILNLHNINKNYTESVNLEIIVQKLCKYLKSNIKQEPFLNF